MSLLLVPVSPAAHADPRVGENTVPGETWSEQGAMAEALRTGTRVEVGSLATDRQQVWADPASESFVAEITAGPTRVKSGSTWKQTDLRLKQEAGRLVAEASPTAVSVSSGGSSPLVSFVDEGRELRVFWPEALPAPVVLGDAAVFPAVRPGVDVVVRTSANGFAMYVVLHSREAAADPLVRDLHLAWEGDGLSLQQTEVGFDAVDTAGVVVFSAPLFAMWSQPQAAAAGPSYGEGGPGVAAAAASLPPVDLTSRVGMDITADEIILTPPASVLDDPATEFPIVIDPEVSKYDLDWSMVWSDGQKFWNSSTQVHRVGYDGWDTTGGFKKVRLFYIMNTSGLDGKIITSAKFRHWQVYSPQNAPNCDPTGGFGPGVELWVTGLASSSTSWSNQPAWKTKLSTAKRAVGNGCPARVTEWDAKVGVQQAADGGWSNVTLGLRSADESDKNGWRKFDDAVISSGSSNRYPVLTVVYNTRPNVPGAPSAVGAVNACGVTYLKNTKPTFQATVSDPDGDQVSGVFYSSSWGGAKTSTPVSSGEKAEYQWSTALPQGDVTMKVAAKDSSGAQSAYGASKTFRIDTVPPATSSKKTLTGPSGDVTAWRNDMVKFEVTRGNADGVKLKYGWGNDTLSNELAFGSNGVATVSRVVTKGGPFTVKFQIYDCAGNVSPIETVQIRIVAQEPSHVYPLDGNGTDFPPPPSTVSGESPIAPEAAKNLTVPAGATFVPGAYQNTVPTDQGLMCAAGDVGATGAAPVRTDGSFAVSMLTQLTATSVGSATSGTAIAFTNGSGTSAVTVARLGWVTDTSGNRWWVFGLADAAGGTERTVTTPMELVEEPPIPGRAGVTHVVVQYNRRDSSMRLFVNGVEKASLGSVSAPVNSASVWVGSGPAANTGLGGMIDNVKFLPTITDNDQITQLTSR